VLIYLRLHPIEHGEALGHAMAGFNHSLNATFCGSVAISSAGFGSALDFLGPAPRAELLHVLKLPDFERADRIGEFWSYPESRAFAELLIDLEEDKAARAVVFGLLAEMQRK
jgi:hypothetical protein